MEDIKSLLVGFVSKTLKLDEATVTSELFESEGDTLKVKDGALEFLTTKDADRIAGFQKTGKDKFQEGYQKAKKEERAALENEIKEKYGISSDAIGVELIGEIIAAQSKGGEVTEDVVKKHPAFIKREKELMKEKEDAITEFKTAQQREKNAGLFKSKSLEILKAQKPVLSQDPTKAENQMKLFTAVLDGEKYEVADNGDIILLNEDGSRMQDKHGHAILLEDRVKSLASQYFDFAQADQRSSGDDPSKKGQGGQGGQGVAAKPANRADYLKQLDSIMRNKEFSAEEKTAKMAELKQMASELKD